MTPSILYVAGVENPPGPLADHRFAIDLNLDQIFAAVNAGREQLDLASVFYAPLGQLDDVTYRHEVLADLERAACPGRSQRVWPRDAPVR